MSKEPLISIVTTVYNGIEFIEESILSIIDQTYKNFEYIIIDAGSNDGTLEIINNYKHKIDKIVSEPDKGIYHGMDKGIRLSRGKYFCIINSDDYLYDKNVLYKISKEINVDNLDFYFGDVIVTNRYSKASCKKVNTSLKGIESRNTIPHMSLLVRKSIYNQLGGYDLSYEVAADYEFTLRMLANKCKFRKLDLTVSYFRKGGYSYMNKKTVYEGYRIRRKHKVGGSKTLFLKHLLKVILFYLKKIKSRLT